MQYVETCKECGAEFVQTHGLQKFCSDVCRKEVRKRLKAEHTRKWIKSGKGRAYHNEYQRRYRRRNPEQRAKHQVRTDNWQKRPQGRYLTQKHNAQRRGIAFKFTFEEWIEWWGDDYDKRGRGQGCLHMARYDDRGSYSPDNCYKATHEENASSPRSDYRNTL